MTPYQLSPQFLEFSSSSEYPGFEKTMFLLRFNHTHSSSGRFQCGTYTCYTVGFEIRLKLGQNCALNINTWSISKGKGAISTPRGAYSPAAVSAHWTYRTHCHLCHTRVKCLAHGHNILTMSQDWEGRNILFFWKSCTKRDSKPHGRQRHLQSALTIAPCPSQWS